MTHKGIHHRGFLPHWDFADSVQAITFRLADSLPGNVVNEWRRELQSLLNSTDSQISKNAQADLHRRIALYEDAGHGSCLLGKPAHAAIVQAAFIEGHGSTYKLIAWCIMPNHVHVLLRMIDDTPLGNIIKKLKASSAIEINRLLGRTGPLWMPDYHDRYIRDMDHLHNSQSYIRNNPVKAGLCEKPEAWPFSSAGINWTAEFIPPESKEAAE